MRRLIPFVVDGADLDVTPVPGIPGMPTQVGLLELGCDVGEIDAIRINASVCAASGAFQAMTMLLGPRTGTHRTCTLRKNTMPGGPQYSRVFGNTSMSINGLQVCPAPNGPSSPYAWRKRKVVWPASTPVPNSSNSKMVFSSPRSVSVDDLTPKRVCLTLAKVLPLGPYSPGYAGNWGRAPHRTSPD